MVKENNFDVSKLSQQEIKNLTVSLLKKISNSGDELEKKLFDVIISIAPQATVEAVMVDSIDAPTKVLVTPRNDHDYPKACHFPGSFLRYGETFQERLNRFIYAELKVGIKKYKDTDLKYNFLWKKNKKHIIGFYFLVELTKNPKVTHRWVSYIPKNLIITHKDFLKNYFGWKEGKSLWE